MDVGWQVKLLILFVLFLFSAFFSGSEVALFSLDKNKLKLNLSGNPVLLRYFTNLLDYPRRLLVTILIGNTIVNVAASIIAVLITIEIAEMTNQSQDLLLSIQIILLTVLIILFGELIPKVLASRKPLAFSKTIIVPLYWISVVLFPIAETLTELIRLSVSKINFSTKKAAISAEEIPELVKLSHEKGTIEQDEKGLIHGIVSFRSVSVQEIMTPRVDMISVSIDTKFEELIDTITKSGHSRIPLYKDDLDQIMGILYAKDILPYVYNQNLRKELSFEKIARKVLFVPKTKMINTLMHEFQEKKMHIAIVVDEYGGTAGLITLEDIIEEIIGEIRDEYDKEESPVIKNENDSFLVLGKLSVDELNELLGTEIETDNEDFETLGGLVLNQAGTIPKEGYHFTMENHKFTVKEVFKKRINKVLIEKISSE
ncbi:MAG: HlyC/CorC family transporter [Ignavibacteriales bacterium]|nr:MAG: HlyC/CorC family transporter [Ignavibacteriales bacterium]